MIGVSTTLHNNMDDISAYFEWKNNVEKNELPGTEHENETVTELSRKLSVSTIVSGDGTKSRMVTTGEAKHKMPINRQVELILKWKEVDNADEDLQKTRNLYEKKMVEFDERWRKIEKGQLEVKQNLVKFNNFVREKQGKVDGGLSRVKHEQEEQSKRVEELKELKKEGEVHAEAKKILGKAVSGRQIFASYLGSVVETDPEKYTDIRRLMERCQALVVTR